MRVAIPSTNGFVGGPGEAAVVYIYEIGTEPKFVEKYQNPAITAPGSPGMWMLRSVIEHGAECMKVGHAGEHVFNADQGKVKIYQAESMTVEDAVKSLHRNELNVMTAPAHGHHH